MVVYSEQKANFVPWHGVHVGPPDLTNSISFLTPERTDRFPLFVTDKETSKDLRDEDISYFVSSFTQVFQLTLRTNFVTSNAIIDLTLDSR